MGRWLEISMVLVMLGGLLIACAPTPKSDTDHEGHDATAAHAAEHFAVVKSAAEWKQLLPKESFYVMREHGTERPHSNLYDKNKEDGVYYCRACGQKLYDAKHKFDSGTGWPSFYQPAEAKAIGIKSDNTLFMTRTEVHCSRCGGHLGHVFDDGPKPTGLRYCMNSASLMFKKRNEAAPPLLK